MRCRRHPRWAGPGACSSCLRERLLVLAAAQDDRCKSDAFDLSSLPRFPRSVSPHEPRRRSSTCGEALHHRYHRNHQIAAPSACRGNKVGHFSFFSSSSWISSFLPGRKKKNSRLFSLVEEPSGAGCRKIYQTVHRGMSPVSDAIGMGETGPVSPAVGETLTESSTGLRRPAVQQRRRSGPGRVEPGSSRPDGGSGEAWGHQAAVFGANRSRKLADFGKYS